MPLAPTFLTVRVTVCLPGRPPMAIDAPLKSLGAMTGMPRAVQYEAGSCVPHRNPSQSLQPGVEHEAGVGRAVRLHVAGALAEDH